MAENLMAVMKRVYSAAVLGGYPALRKPDNDPSFESGVLEQGDIKNIQDSVP